MKCKEDLTEFEVRMIRIMTNLYRNNGVNDEIIELLRLINIDYHVLKKENETLRELIHIDNKTNLLKYREDYLSTIFKTASRLVDRMPQGMFSLSYIRFDIDDFSVVNNMYGHETGDMVLVDLASLLKKNSRPTDYVIRYGGEEFDVILPATDNTGAQEYLEKIYRDMNSELNYSVGETSLRISASAGVSSMDVPFNKMNKMDSECISENYSRLQKFADDALYHAKLSGKNQYRFYQDSMDYNEIRQRYTQSKMMPLH